MVRKNLQELPLQELQKKHKTYGNLFKVFLVLIGLFLIVSVYLFIKKTGNPDRTTDILPLVAGLAACAAGTLSVRSSQKQVAEELSRRGEG